MFHRALTTLATAAASASVLFAAGAPRVLPEGTLPKDHRLEPVKDLDGYFPFTPPASAEAWTKRAAQVRRQILVSQGLWPLPTKTPLNPVIHGRIDQGEYTVEKVYFESAPGFFVTGNLYRPAKLSGKAPAVLFAHGHWKDARLSETSPKELREEIADGAERFENGGRSRFQSMCVQLARMGCIVWQWDMLGDSDSQQFTRDFIHGFSKQRPEMNTEDNWGLFSPQAEAHLQSAMGLQTWNAERSLDFVLSLPEVDPSRIAMTGASGGGTQTMLLSAVDSRIALSFPAVMVSTAMQGGCTCENASLLRVGTGNVEFAALFAPKPLGITCANDWTKEVSTKGFPELKQLYTLLGAPENVMLKRGEHFPHNYNAVSRSAFYTWLNRHFKLGQTEPVIEKDYTYLTREQLTVWDAAHPAPKSGDPEFERSLLQSWHKDSESQLSRMKSNSTEEYLKTLRGGWDVVLDGTLETAGNASWELKAKADKGTWIEMAGLVHNTSYHEELPAVFAYPKQWNGHTVIWLSEQGKSGLYNTDGSLLTSVQKVVDSGATVLGLDLLYQGEFLANGTPLTLAPKVKNPREATAFTLGYNPPVFVQRMQDVLTALRLIQTHEHQSKRVSIVAVDGTGPIAAAVRAQSGKTIERAAIHIGEFRFGKVLDWRSPNLVPGAAKYGDVNALLELGSGALKQIATANDGAAAAEFLTAP